MTDLVRNYINGKWVESHSGKSFESYNPATGELISTVTKGDAEDVNAAVAAAKAAYDSWRLTPAPRRGEIIFRAAQILVERKEEIARLLIGGKFADPIGNGKGSFYKPTLFDDVMPGMRIAQEEIFGPVLSVIECETLEEAVKINNNTAYGLSSSIFTENVNAAFSAIRDLSTGIVYINHGTIGAEIQFSFGGTRGTGNGMREAGQTALDTFTEWKSVYVDYSGQLQRAQIDTDSILGGKIE